MEREGEGEKGGTIIRVKRKRTQTPQDALVLRYTSPAKKRAVDSVSEQLAQLTTHENGEGRAKPINEGKILKLVHTTASRNADWQARIEDFKKTHKGPTISANQRQEKTLQHSRIHAKSSRYKLLQMCREEDGLYNIVDIIREDEQDKSDNKKRDRTPHRFPVIPREKSEKEPPKLNKPRFVPNIQNARKKQTPPQQEDTFCKYLPLVEEYLQQNVSIASQQEIERTDGEYEYDIYYFDDTLDEGDLDNKYQLVTLEAFDENSLLCDEYISDHDSEDSNDAENPDNDYPEEEEGFSSDENQYAQTNSFSDSDLDWCGEADYHYHAPSSDEDGEENQSNGVTPDFDFFYANWTKMRK